MIKLIRDRVERRVGDKLRIATNDEMPLLLARKLVEEANEVLEVVQMHESVFPNPKHKKVRLIEEIADVSTAFAALARLHGITPTHIQVAGDHKYQLKGDFSEGWVLENATDDRVETKLRTLVEDLLNELVEHHMGHRGTNLPELTQRAEELGCLGTVA